MRLPCLLAVLAAGPALAQHTLATGRFEVLFPDAPTLEERQATTALGTFLTRSWTLELGPDTWILAETEYPRGVLERFGVAALLATARDEAVGTVAATLEQETPVELEPQVPWAPFPGVELHARSPVGALVSARIYLVDTRLYQLIRVRLARSADEASFEVFTGSFRIRPFALGPGPASPPPGRR